MVRVKVRLLYLFPFYQAFCCRHPGGKIDTVFRIKVLLFRIRV